MKRQVSSLQDIRLELLSLSGMNGIIEYTFISGLRAFEYKVSVPVENYLSDPNEQNAPENFMGFNLSLKLQPTRWRNCSRFFGYQNGLRLMIEFLLLIVSQSKSFEDLRIF